MFPEKIRVALKFLAELDKIGFPAYIVGGSVRDLLSGRAPADVDVAVGTPLSTLMKILPTAKHVGRAEGRSVLILPYFGMTIEISRMAFDSLEKDLARRDFTIDAIAMDKQGTIIDPLQGMKDIAAKTIRYTGSPAERLHEDPLRALRYWRLMATLPGFSPVEDYGGYHRNALDGVLRAPHERVGVEVRKALAGNFSLFIHGLGQDGLLRSVLPLELRMKQTLQPMPFHPEGDVLAHTLNVVRRVEEPGLAHSVKLAALFHDVGKATVSGDTAHGKSVFYGHERESARIADSAMAGWNIPSQISSEACTLIEKHMLPHQAMTFSSVGRLVRTHGMEWLNRLFLLARADCECPGACQTWSENRKLAATSAARLSCSPDGGRRRFLSGNDVMTRLGIAPGEQVGEILKTLDDAVAEGIVTDRGQAIRWLDESHRVEESLVR